MTVLEQSVALQTRVTDYFKRVLGNDATKRGAASAVAGVVVACLVEAVWPTKA